LIFFFMDRGNFISSTSDLIFLTGTFAFPVRRFEGYFADGNFIFSDP